MDKNNESFGERLKELRIQTKIGQIELAQKLGVSKAIISYWENNLKEPKLSNLVALSKFFNVPIDYLACLTD